MITTRFTEEFGIDHPVVMGGIHASVCPDEALQFVDAVVVGEAESVWGQVLSDAESGQLQPRYQGTWQELNNLQHVRRDIFHEDYVFGSIQRDSHCAHQSWWSR